MKLVKICGSAIALILADANLVHSQNVHAFKPTAPYKTLMLTPLNENVTRVTVQNGPINLFDNNLLFDMLPYLKSLVPRPNVPRTAPKVVIFDSLNPDYFIMHRDVQGIIPPLAEWKLNSIHTYIAITRYLQNITTTVFIGEVNGRAFGAGNEVAVQMDMRFAGPGALVGFFESGLGVFPGGGGTQFLADLVGKARTLEYSLGTMEINGKHGAEIGWFNRYFEDPKQLSSFVNALACRIGIYPEGIINATKAGLNWRNAPIDVLEGDIAEFVKLDMMVDRAPLERALLVRTQNETNEFERNLPADLPLLYGEQYADLAKAGRSPK